MSKKKIKAFSCNDSVFQRNLYIVVGDAEKSKEHILRKFLLTEESQELESVDDDNMGGFDKLDQGERTSPIFLVWLRQYKGTPKDIAVLAHEILHLTFEVMRHSDVHYSEDFSEEIYAYYMDSILSQAIKKLK